MKHFYCKVCGHEFDDRDLPILRCPNCDSGYIEEDTNMHGDPKDHVNHEHFNMPSDDGSGGSLREQVEVANLTRLEREVRRLNKENKLLAERVAAAVEHQQQIDWFTRRMRAAVAVIQRTANVGYSKAYRLIAEEMSDYYNAPR